MKKHREEWLGEAHVGGGCEGMKWEFHGHSVGIRWAFQGNSGPKKGIQLFCNLEMCQNTLCFEQLGTGKAPPSFPFIILIKGIQ